MRDPVFEILKKDANRLLGAASPRRVELVQMSLVRDGGGWLLNQIPVVGHFISDAFQDNVWADMKGRMSSPEVETFTEVTRHFPDTVALINTFQRMPE